MIRGRLGREPECWKNALSEPALPRPRLLPAALRAQRVENTMPTFRIVLAAACVALLAACSQEAETPPASTDYPIETAETPVAEAEAPMPSVQFTASNTTALEPGGSVTLTVTVEHFTLDGERIGAANEDGVGHYRVYWDDASGDDYLGASAEPELTVTVPENTTDGSHRLRVMLVNNDGTPLDPPVEEGVWVVVYRV